MLFICGVLIPYGNKFNGHSYDDYMRREYSFVFTGNLTHIAVLHGQGAWAQRSLDLEWVSKCTSQVIVPPQGGHPEAGARPTLVV